MELKKKKYLVELGKPWKKTRGLSMGKAKEDFPGAWLSEEAGGGGRQLHAVPNPWRQIHITSHSLQIPLPGGTRKLDPQRETGMPASGRSTDPTLPSQHTLSPQTGDCPHPGLRDPWTRRVTAIVSAHHKTQVGPAFFFPDHSRLSQALWEGVPVGPFFPPA